MIFLVFLMYNKHEIKERPRRGGKGSEAMDIKSRVTPQGKTIFILTGTDTTNEVAAFQFFAQAALVARYISGGNMPDEYQTKAMAAIIQYDELREAGKIHHEAGGEEWAE